MGKPRGSWPQRATYFKGQVIQCPEGTTQASPPLGFPLPGNLLCPWIPARESTCHICEQFTALSHLLQVRFILGSTVRSQPRHLSESLAPVHRGEQGPSQLTLAADTYVTTSHVGTGPNAVCGFTPPTPRGRTTVLPFQRGGQGRSALPKVSSTKWSMRSQEPVARPGSRLPL